MSFEQSTNRTATQSTTDRLLSTMNALHMRDQFGYYSLSIPEGSKSVLIIPEFAMDELKVPGFARVIVNTVEPDKLECNKKVMRITDYHVLLGTGYVDVQTTMASQKINEPFEPEDFYTVHRETEQWDLVGGSGPVVMEQNSCVEVYRGLDYELNMRKMLNPESGRLFLATQGVLLEELAFCKLSLQNEVIQVLPKNNLFL